MELHLRHHSPRPNPSRRLIEKALAPDQRFVARPSHWPRQQLRNVPLQIVIRGKADRVLHVPLFQRRLASALQSRPTTLFVGARPSRSGLESPRAAPTPEALFRPLKSSSGAPCIERTSSS